MILEMNSAHPGDLGLKQSCRQCRGNSSRWAQAKYEVFCGYCPKLWNVMPVDVPGMVNPRSFMRVLTEWGLKCPDRPPFAGYRRSDDISLLSVYQWSI